MSIFTMICVFYFGLKSNAIYDTYKKTQNLYMLVFKLKEHHMKSDFRNSFLFRTIVNLEFGIINLNKMVDITIDNLEEKFDEINTSLQKANFIGNQ